MTMKPPSPREWLIVAAFALAAALLLVRLVPRPTNTDSFYHFNAAARLAAGQGLTETTVWTYVGQPERDAPVTDIPSHLYWMPFTSMLAALGMTLAGVPGDFAAAQLPLALCLAGALLTAHWLGYKLGGGRRQAVTALLLAAFSGFFVNYWGEIDTFAPYALIGSLALIGIGLGAERQDARWFALAGVLAGLGHLTRSDGLLLLLTGWCVLLWPWWRSAWRARAVSFGLFTLAYLLVMLPWFVRMTEAVRAPLPLGGLGAIWFTEYNDLFRYPPVFAPADLLSDGPGLLIQTRLEALTNNLGTLLAVEGYAVLLPLMLVGLWRRRGLFTLGLMLFALGLHAAMTFVFPFPGYRGGLFHGVAALLPWWAALAPAGLDAAVDWVVQRRRHWRAPQAKVIFSVGMVLLAVALTVMVLRPPRAGETPALWLALADVLPPDARVMLNDPPQLYYFTGMGGVVLPSAAPQVIPDIARAYNVTHLLLYDLVEDADGRVIGAPVPAALWPLFESSTPDFLEPLPFNLPRARLYAIRAER